MIKVLFVCLGNICRSPLAEAIFNHKIKQLKLTNHFLVDSCGTGNYHIGSQPDKRTIKVSTDNGVNIFHACRQLEKSDLYGFDYILAMDKSNYQDIVSLADSLELRHKVLKMREFDKLFHGFDVPDPYYGGDREFQEVYDILNRSLDGFIAHLRKMHSL